MVRGHNEQTMSEYNVKLVSTAGDELQTVVLGFKDATPSVEWESIAWFFNVRSIRLFQNSLE